MCALVCCIVRSASFYTFALFTTKTLHERMLSSVTQTRTRFFDLNPIGRILNRFSKDIGNIDDVLPLTLYDLCQVHLISCFDHRPFKFKFRLPKNQVFNVDFCDSRTGCLCELLGAGASDTVDDRVCLFADILHPIFEGDKENRERL
jgi:hypothetical protein